MLFLLAFFLPPLVFCQGYKYAQDYTDEITVKKVVAGHFNDGTDIYATRYSFPYHIVKFDVDSTRNEALIILRKAGKKYYKDKGYIMLMNLTTGKIVWSHSIGSFDYNIGADVYFKAMPQNNVCFDRRTGDKLWTGSLPVAYIDEVNKIGITDRGICYDLFTGKKKWDANIARTYGWYNVSNTDKNTSIITTDEGIYNIDITTGLNWEYAVKTTTKDYKAVAAGSVAAVAVGVLTGVMIMPGTDPDLTTHICSDIYIKKDVTYFADKTHVFALDANGKVIWEHEVPKGITHSRIIELDDAIYLIGMGYVYRSGIKHYNDAVYIAAYSKESGKQQYVWNNDIKGVLYDMQVKNNMAVLRFTDDIIQFDMTNGKIVTQRKLIDDRYKAHHNLLSGDMIYTEDNLASSLARRYPASILLSNGNSIIVMDKDFQVISSILYKDLYVPTTTSGNVLLLDGAAKTLLAVENHPRAKLNGNNYKLSTDKAILITLEYMDIIDRESLSPSAIH